MCSWYENKYRSIFLYLNHATKKEKLYFHINLKKVSITLFKKVQNNKYVISFICQTVISLNKQREENVWRMDGRRGRGELRRVSRKYILAVGNEEFSTHRTALTHVLGQLCAGDGERRSQQSWGARTHAQTPPDTRATSVSND